MEHRPALVGFSRMEAGIRGEGAGWSRVFVRDGSMMRGTKGSFVCEGRLRSSSSDMHAGYFSHETDLRLGSTRCALS